MRIAFLTASVHLYLPAFFERVLDEYEDQTVGVFVVPPLLGDQTVFGAPFRYGATFGLAATVNLITRTVWARMRRRTIKAVCKKHGVLYERVPRVNDEVFLRRLRALGTDLIVSVSCPQIFKQPLIELPARGCLNIHGSILPDYRGVMPSFWMLAEGQKQAGVSIIFVNKSVDAGDLCAQRVFEIRDDETLAGFLLRSKTIAADLLLETLPRFENGTVERTPIDVSRGSYHSYPDRDAVRQFRAAGRRLW